jgi:hypothetical protein
MALVRPHEEPLRWRLPAALQMIRKSMKTLHTMACAIAFAVPRVVAAQANLPENPSAATTTPQLTYESAFQDYRPHEDVPVADWRQVNDTVRQATTKGGGHGSHGAPDSKGLEGSAAPKEAAPPPKSGQQHMGHGMRGGKGMQGGQGMHGGHQ